MLEAMASAARMRGTFGAAVLVATLSCPVLALAQEMVEVAPVWSGHPVDFALVTQGSRQFVAYYDSSRDINVAQRDIPSTEWKVQRLDERTNWDSHTYITMALDAEGYVHLCGNMHISPLVYFRSEVPYDVTTLKRREAMVGTEESAVTYPTFLQEEDGTLLFYYRHGRSGQGNDWINRYTAPTRLWQRLNFKSLTDGEGVRNAYLDKFQRGPDGLWHLCWVWREAGDAGTTNTPSYARTRDFRSWENVQGEKLELPLRSGANAVADPVPQHSGMVNGNIKLGFTLDGRPVMAYHKNNARGTQVFVAGWDGEKWVVNALTDYDHFWKITGTGTLKGEIGVRRPRAEADGSLSIQWSHLKFGTHRMLVDGKTFTALHEAEPLQTGTPRQLRKVESTTPGMTVRFKWGTGDDGDAAHDWAMRWETLPSNHDRARDLPWPDPTPLRLYKLEAPEMQD